MVMRTRKRWGLLVVGAVILLLLMVYPWLGCTIDRNQVLVSLNKRWTMVTLEGFAVGLVFNITNAANCDLHLESVVITVHKATYRDGVVENLEFTETQDKTSVIPPGRTERVDFTFDHMLRRNPTQLTMQVEMSFREIGTIVALEGEVQMPART
jgi:uncharacterized membrane protein